MTALRVVLLCAAALGATNSAIADSFPVTFTGVNGSNAFGYYLSPYTGTVNGDPVTLYCVDFANEVYIGQSWQANLTLLSSSDLSNTRYGGVPNAHVLYEQAAWLTTQFASHPGDSADIQATIWQLFVPSAPSPGSTNWLTLAQLNYGDIDPSYFRIVTNVGPVLRTGQVQEFLFDSAPVPEPGSVVLLGTVALLVGWAIRRRCKVAH